MSDPTSFPTWRFYPDGRRIVVHTPAEYAALEPGHSDRPDGPWPGAPEPGPEMPAGVEETAPLPDQRERARALRDDGLSRRAIADALGVTEYTVRRLLEDP